MRSRQCEAIALGVCAALTFAPVLGAQSDWAQLGRYAAANEALLKPAHGENRVVFMGNSITESWGRHFDSMFPGKPYINRGISGQTTPQMLVRFRQDVIALAPKAVVILAGTNDIAGNTGPATAEQIAGNIVSMAELARANGITVVLASVLPAARYPWRPAIEPVDSILRLNAALETYARLNGIVYVDFHPAMVDDRGGLRTELSGDGVHPNEAGYRVMAPLVSAALERVLR